MVSRSERGEDLLAYLDAAYNLARWLIRNEQDARDVVQDAFVKAIRFNGTVNNKKAWFLAIVRNQVYSTIKKRIPTDSLDDLPLDNTEANHHPSAEEIHLKLADLQMVRSALLSISEEHREVFILREMEGLSYQEMAAVLNLQTGTVMSRLARARVKIIEALREEEHRQERMNQ